MPLLKNKITRFILAIVLALGLLSFVYFTWSWNHPLTQQAVTYHVAPGQTLRGLARELHEKKIIDSKLSFILLGFVRGDSRQLKVGEYRFQGGTSMRGLLDQVVAGEVIQYSLVLVEGWTFKQFIQALHQAPKLKPTLKGMSPPQIMERLGYTGEHPEGRFYPDTYTYAADISDVQILQQAYRRMQTRLTRVWQDRDPNLPIQTPYQALILASIIEKETGQRDERQTIAAVFINRLRRNMRLQTDPTVIYGMGGNFDGNLRRRDLRRDGPYNTYTRRGLPPTPIAMPGGDSLYAAVHPTASGVLFFVAKGDGSHYFSETLAEHNRAVIKYQLKGRTKTPSSTQSKNRRRRD